MSTQCITPIQVSDGKGGKIFVPCGKCVPCGTRRISGWSKRLIEEDKVSSISWFVTLTYDNDHVPMTKNKFMTLRKSDVQGFIKRLRYYSKGKKIKYYAAGEYGSDTMRPHYHLILFNAEPDEIDRAWCENGQTIGNVYYGNVQEASVGYTLKYISKKGKIPMHKRDDRVPEFSLSSTKLGAAYIEKYRKWHEADMLNRMYCNIEDGKRIAMPRYYKDKLYTKEQREHIGDHVVRKSEEINKRIIEDYGPDYYRDKAEADKQAIKRKDYLNKKGDKL